MSSLFRQVEADRTRETITPRPRHRVHPNSVAAYRAEQPRLSSRVQKILDHVTKHGGGTDRQIAEAMWYPERSHVQPRISELVQAGLLVEVNKIKCPVTGNTVRVVGVAK